MFLTLALVMLQGPAPQWSRDVDDQFWQALHLLEVEDRAVEAAASLAALLEEPSVRQYRGQTGYLLAQQYRALRAAGRLEEAEALLTTIRADVAGTDLAAAAESVVQLADRTHPRQSGVDDELLELLLDAANQDDSEYLRSLLQGYGERAIPELLRIFDRPEDYSGQVTPASHHGLKALWYAAWDLNSDKFLDAMASRLKLRGSSYARALPLSFVGAVGDAQAEFLVKLFHDERMELAAIARPSLPHAVKHRRVAEALVSLVKEGRPIAPAVINDLVMNGGPAERLAVVDAGIDSEIENLRSLTRDLILSRFDAFALHHLAERRGDQEARIVLLWEMFPNDHVLLTALPEWKARVMEMRRSHAEGYFSVPTDESGEALVNWSLWIRAQLQSSDEAVRSLAIARALRDRTEARADLLAAVQESVEKHGVPDSFHYAWVKSGYVPPALDAVPSLVSPFLQQLGEPSAGKHITDIIDQSPVFRATMSVEQLQAILPHCERDGQPLRLLGKAQDHPQGHDAWRERVWRIAEADIPIVLSSHALSQVFNQTWWREEVGTVPLEEIEKALSWAQGRVGDFSPNAHPLESILAALKFSLESGAVEDPQKFDELLAEWIRMAARGKSEGWRRSNARGMVSLFPRAQRAGVSCEQSVAALLDHPGYWSDSQGDVYAAIEGVCWKVPELMERLLVVAKSFPESYLDGKSIAPYHARTGVTTLRAPSMKVILEANEPKWSRHYWMLYSQKKLAPLGQLEPLFQQYADRDLREPDLALYVVQSISADESEQERFVEAVQAAWALPDLVARSGLVNTVASRYTPELIPFLLEAQAHPDYNVSAAADAALSRYTFIRETRVSWEAWARAGREGSPIDSLIEKITADNKRIVRIAAIESLGTLQAKEALPFLVELLEEDDEEIVAAVSAALTQIHAASKGDQE